MPELLLELLSEEIPARMQARAASDLQRLVCDGLKSAGLSFTKAEAFATPRRLTLVVDGIPEMQPDVSEERKGPAVGAPEQAIAGFLKSVGLASVDGCEVREVKGKPTYFVVSEKKGRPAGDVLGDVLTNALAALPWAKSMRWADHALRWVRPVHSMVCLFSGAAIPVTLGPVMAGNQTRGHRFLSSGEITVTDFADYQSKLTDAHVMLDGADRRAKILADSNALAAEAGLVLRPDEGLLAEVAGLVEWPVTLMGSIDTAFMDVPSEVLVTTMRTHQKYFALEDKDGNLAPRFIVVSNMIASDGGTAIVAGNERVLRARLSDARFFWDQDRKETLGSRAPKLKDIVFHAKLGTLDEKMDRVEALASELSKSIKGADKNHVRSAARLAKCDLVAGMVYEFPELQGIMGRYYALNDGESIEVANAIAEHYSPLGPNDACPTAPVSVCVALADKLDTLVGFWGIDEKPTGSKDPFALRRAALGVIRLILENGLRLSLLDVFAKAGAKDVAGDLLSFFSDRLKGHLKEKGTKHDHVDAVFAGGEDDFVRLLARVDALGAFLSSEDGANLLVAYKRAANILKIEEKKDKTSYATAADAKLLDQGEEKTLHKALAQVAKKTAPLMKAEDYAGVMGGLATLRGPVDAFFDHVTVNADDATLRQNRLRLLSEIRSTMEAVADFSKIEG